MDIESYREALEEFGPDAIFGGDGASQEEIAERRVAMETLLAMGSSDDIEDELIGLTRRIMLGVMCGANEALFIVGAHLHFAAVRMGESERLGATHPEQP